MYYNETACFEKFEMQISFVKKKKKKSMVRRVEIIFSSKGCLNDFYNLIF